MARTPHKPKPRNPARVLKGSPLGFRVPDDVKAALERAAEADERSVSFVATKIISEWLKENGFLK
jgi:predicted transcriptional regulator